MCPSNSFTEENVFSDQSRIDLSPEAVASARSVGEKRQAQIPRLWPFNVASVVNRAEAVLWEEKGGVKESEKILAVRS